LPDRPKREQPSYQTPDGFVRPLEEERRINEAFKLVFAGAAGDLVASYLRSITVLNVRGPKDLDPTELVHLEGQRFLSGLIEARITLGKNNLPGNK